MTDPAEFARLAKIPWGLSDRLTRDEWKNIQEALRFRANATEERIAEVLHRFTADESDGAKCNECLTKARPVLAALKGEG